MAEDARPGKDEYHFLITDKYLPYTNEKDLKTIFEKLKTSSFFVSYHNGDGEFPVHLHLVSSISKSSANSKIQQSLTKLKKRIEITDANFNELLKLSNNLIPGDLPTRTQWAKTISSQNPIFGVDNSDYEGKNSPDIQKLCRFLKNDATSANDIKDCQSLIPSCVLENLDIVTPSITESLIDDAGLDERTRQIISRIENCDADTKLSKSAKWDILDYLIEESKCTTVPALQRHMKKRKYK